MRFLKPDWFFCLTLVAYTVTGFGWLFVSPSSFHVNGWKLAMGLDLWLAAYLVAFHLYRCHRGARNDEAQ